MRTLNARPGSKEARAAHLADLRETSEWKTAKSLMMRQRWNEPEWRESFIRTAHGMSSHPLYQIWCGMMARCYNENGRSFKYYGALGVTVYEPWHDPRVFIADIEAKIGQRPDDGQRMSNGRPWYSIDRINVFGNYEPGNVRWADPKMQRANQRKSVA
jgi:hypothetical protein